jgi:hypothetical protein
MSRNKNPFFMNINLNHNDEQKEPENLTSNEKTTMNSHRNPQPKLNSFSPFNKGNFHNQKKICNIVLGNTGSLIKNYDKTIPIFKGKFINTFLLNMENKEFQEYKTLNSQSKNTFFNIAHKKSNSINNKYSSSSKQMINISKPLCFTPKKTSIEYFPKIDNRISDNVNILVTLSSRYGMKSNSSKKIQKPFSCFKTMDMYYN